MRVLADVRTFEKELHSEIERIVIRYDLPDAWTYPDIQPLLIREALARTGKKEGKTASEEQGAED